jgi:hypothetical protein
VTGKLDDADMSTIWKDGRFFRIENGEVRIFYDASSARKTPLKLIAIPGEHGKDFGPI